MTNDVTARFLGDTSGLDKASKHVDGITGHIGSAFSRMGGQIGGEIGTLVSNVGDGFSKISESGGAMSAKFGAAGGAALALGLSLEMLGSKDKAAQQQLKTSIEDTGNTWDDYEGKVEKAIKTQENFAHTADDTQTALRILTQATNDPTKALQQMGLVADLAAARHTDLATAAALVAKVINGAGAKTLKEYGIILTKTGATAKDVTTAENNHTKAVAALDKAQRKLTDLTQLDASKKKLSVAAEIALKNAHLDVLAAQQKVTATTELLTKVTLSAKEATNGGATALDQLAKKIKGQAAASVDTFAGKVDVLKTKVEDFVSLVSGPVGIALANLGTGVIALSVLMEIWGQRQAKAAAASLALAAAEAVQAEAIAGLTVEQAALVVEVDAMIASMDGEIAAAEAAAAATGSLGAAVDVALGPIGLIVAALGLAAGAALLFTHRTSDEVKPIGDVTAALHESRDAYLADVRAKQLHAILSEKNIGLLQKLGISMDTVTAAVGGNKTAQQQVNSVLDAAIAKQTTYTTGMGRQGIATKQVIPLVSSLGSQFQDLQGVFGGLNGQIAADTKQWNYLNSAIAKSAEAVIRFQAVGGGKFAPGKHGQALAPGTAAGGMVGGSRAMASGGTWSIDEHGYEGISISPNGQVMVTPHSGSMSGSSGGLVMNFYGPVLGTKDAFAKFAATAMDEAVAKGVMRKPRFAS